MYNYILYNNNELATSSLREQDIINFLNKKGIQLGCTDDLFNNDIMKEYKLKITKVPADF